MNKKYIYECLLNIIDKEDIKLDEPMKKHISFRVGGPADILVKPRTEEQIAKVVKLLKEEKILMQCILSIVPQVQLNLQEEVNIYQMSKLICYLDGLQEIFKKLMIDEK